MLDSKIRIRLIHFVMLLSFFAAMNLFDKYYYFVFVAFAMLCLNLNAKTKIDVFPVSMLILLAFSWLAFAPDAAYSVLGVIKTFTYCICYLIGFWLVDNYKGRDNKESTYKLFYVFVAVIALGLLVHYGLNWMYNADTYDSRNTIDVWTGEGRAATGQAALGCLPLGLAIGCLFTNCNKTLKAFSIIAIVVVLGYNLILSGRTLIVILLCTFAVALLHRFFRGKKGNFKVLLIVILLIAMLFVAFEVNLFGIKSVVKESPLYQRFFASNSSMELDEDGRLDNKIYYLKHLDEAILGGNKLREKTGFAHDIILDTYDEGGIFALLAMIGFLLNSFVHLLKCLKDRTLPLDFRQIVLCIYIAIYMEFMVEPILQGMQWLFASFCMIDGYVGQFLIYERTSKTVGIQ